MDEEIDQWEIYKVEIQRPDEQGVLPEQGSTARITTVTIPVRSVRSGCVQTENTDKTELQKNGE